MNRIQKLITQIDCVSELLVAKIETERSFIHDQIFSQIVTTYQKVSLAEKQYSVKNACSPNASEV